MVYFGTIMETTKDKTYVFTLDCDMVALKTKDDYYIGQQVSFEKKDFYRASNILNITSHKNFKFITTIAAVLFLAIIIGGGAFLLGRGSAGGFDENVMALVSVDINPSIEFEVNKDDEIISAKCYNDEGQDILDQIEFRGMVLEAGIQEVIKAAKELGYINEDVNIVLVSGTLYGEETDNAYATQLKNILESLQGASGGTSVMSVYVDDSSVYDLASQNDISIGKALLYQYAIAQGLTITLDDIKTSSITELMSKLDLQVANLEVDTQTPTETTTVAPTTTTTQPTTRVTNTTTSPSNGGNTSSWSPYMEAYVANGALFFNWSALNGDSVTYNGKTYYGFKYYKIAYDQYDSTPTYPENSYLTYIDNYSKNTYSYTPSAGGKLGSGVGYYFGITYVFENGYIYSNNSYMTSPTYSMPEYTPFSPSLSVTTSGSNVTLNWTSTPSEYVSNGGSNYSDFYYYKVVWAESYVTTQPRYGENGWVEYIDNTTINSKSYNFNTNYNGSTTFNLQSGKSYCFGVTYVYKTGKIYTYWSTPVTIP